MKENKLLKFEEKSSWNMVKFDESMLAFKV